MPLSEKEEATWRKEREIAAVQVNRTLAKSPSERSTVIKGHLAECAKVFHGAAQISYATADVNRHKRLAYLSAHYLLNIPNLSLQESQALGLTCIVTPGSNSPEFVLTCYKALATTNQSRYWPGLPHELLRRFPNDRALKSAVVEDAVNGVGKTLFELNEAWKVVDELQKGGLSEYNSLRYRASLSRLIFSKTKKKSDLVRTIQYLEILVARPEDPSLHASRKRALASMKERLKRKMYIDG
ncbi:hypothetical protein QPK87_05180 [Kamptonema cortianum]|nr:hypothetical protein [Kamptonema cortianum]